MRGPSSARVSPARWQDESSKKEFHTDPTTLLTQKSPPMNPYAIMCLVRPASFIKMVALTALTSLLPVPGAKAFAPQDSTHLTRTIPRLPGETQWHAAMVAGDRVWYPVSHGHGPIRARNSQGDLIFEHVAPQIRIATSGYHPCSESQYAKSSSGQLYHFTEPQGQRYQQCVTIIHSDSSETSDIRLSVETSTVLLTWPQSYFISPEPQHHKLPFRRMVTPRTPLPGQFQHPPANNLRCLKQA